MRSFLMSVDFEIEYYLSHTSTEYVLENNTSMALSVKNYYRAATINIIIKILQRSK